MYGGTNVALRDIISKLGVEVTWVKADSVEEYKKSVRSNTKVWIEKEKRVECERK